MRISLKGSEMVVLAVEKLNIFVCRTWYNISCLQIQRTVFLRNNFLLIGSRCWLWILENKMNQLGTRERLC